MPFLNFEFLILHFYLILERFSRAINHAAKFTGIYLKIKHR